VSGKAIYVLAPGAKKRIYANVQPQNRVVLD